jgi:hypothetical protein
MPANEKGVIIKPGGTTDGSVLRARDVEFQLKGADIDPRVKNVLCTLAEINHVNMKAIAELGSMFDKMVDVMTDMTTVAGNMREMTDRYLKEREGADVEPDITTQ